MSRSIAPEAYERAWRILRSDRSELVRGMRVHPHWLGGTGRFWYAHESERGRRYSLVDPGTGTREPAFDHERLAAALAAAAGEEVDSGRLPLEALELGDASLSFEAFGSRWNCALESYSCVPVDDVVERMPGEVPSPDGKLSVFRRGDDLWARSLETGNEWPLTRDGTPEYGYGVSADSAEPRTLLDRLGIPQLPPLVVWSPDSTRIVTHRTDQRGVGTLPLVRLGTGGERPRAVERRYALPGDDVVPLAELLVIEVAPARPIPARTAPLVMSYISPIATSWVWWSASGATVYFLDRPRDLRTLRLHRLDAETGEVSVVIEEHASTRIEPAQEVAQKPIVRVLRDERRVLWYSQRDGWGHLYLYDAGSGEPIARLTSGEWAVQEILAVDEDAGLVHFLASGLVESDPYRRSVCRVGLDGTGFLRLTEDDLDHLVQVSPNGEFFLDTASTAGTPPRIVVRDGSGRALVDLGRADVSGLEATGWAAPEQVRVVAADGVTPLYGLLYRPHDFDPAKRYPVVDHLYPGPQRRRVQPSFDQGAYGYEAEALAAIGFAVLAIDGRGTPGRSKAFHDESYGRLADAGGLEDHVSALEQLAASRPWMDLERVGVFGRSGGGFATVRAMCDFPEVYKVGVAECGNHDNRIYHLLWSESYDGPYDAEVAERSSNVGALDRLTGELLLVHGGSDDNVTPHHTLRLVERLIELDKDFELLIVPGAEHGFVGYEHYVARRKWDYFVRRLLGALPPAGYRLPAAPIDRKAIAATLGVG